MRLPSEPPEGLGYHRCIGCVPKADLVDGFTEMKLVERAAHGFLNDARLFLKFRATFAGKP